MRKPYKELRRRIEDADLLMHELAEQINISPQSLSNKLSGRAQWKTRDVVAICQVLGIPRSEVGRYFFPEIPDPADDAASDRRTLPGWLAG